MREGRFGRIFLGPDHDPDGPHPGYRGFVVLDGAWVHLNEDAEWLQITPGDGGYPDHEWVLVEGSRSIPAATVVVIEWDVPSEGGSSDDD